MAAIEIVRGATTPLELSVVDADGVPYTAPSDGKMIFGVKKKGSTELLIVKTMAAGGTAGTYTVTLDPADTEGLAYGRYLFDVGLQSGAAFHNVVMPEPLEIVENVTKWGCAG